MTEYVTHHQTNSHFIDEMIKKEQQEKTPEQKIVQKELDAHVALILQRSFRIIDSKK